MAKQVFTEPIDLPNGNANRKFLENATQLVGNKRVLVRVGKVFPDGPNVYNPRIQDLVINEQKDEFGNDVDMFEIDNVNHTFKLKAGLTIENIIRFEFNDRFVIRRNSGTGSPSEAAQQFSVFEASVDGLTNNEVRTFEIMESVSDSRDIAIDASFEKVYYYKSIITNDNKTLNENNQFAWGIGNQGSTEMQLKEFEISMTITWYDPNIEGGN